MTLRTLFDDPSAWAVLAERARALAIQEQDTNSSSGATSLIFSLGDNGYCLPAAAVREVQPLGVYTALPDLPAFVVGLVNLRGRLLAAIDLRPLLGLSAAPPADGAWLLIVTADGIEIGLIADRVVAVQPSPDELLPGTVGAAESSVAWVRGVDPLLNLHLDPALLFADPALAVDSAGRG